MSELVEPVFLSQGPFGRLRELQSMLAKSDIPAEIVQPPGCDANA